MNKKEYTSPYCVVHSLYEEVVLLAGTGNNQNQPSNPTLRVDNESGKEIEEKKKTSSKKNSHIFAREIDILVEKHFIFVV